MEEGEWARKKADDSAQGTLDVVRTGLLVSHSLSGFGDRGRAGQVAGSAWVVTCSLCVEEEVGTAPGGLLGPGASPLGAGTALDRGAVH